MIGELKPYSTYKDSRVPWLGEVPEHWEIVRGKNLFQCIDIRSQTGEEELLTVSSERGVIPRKSANVTMFKAESYSGHKLCWPDDLVINSLWAWARGLGVSKFHGIISTAYGVYRIREKLLNPRYVHELVRSVPFHWELKVRSKGVWTSRLQLTDDSFLNAPFPVPPDKEQAAIATFLDYADRRIRRYIRSKQKLIKLLEEQKQVVINEAVTRGLDPKVPLKRSGIGWLGDIPEHWELKRLKQLVVRIDQGVSPQAENYLAENGRWGVLKAGCVNRGLFQDIQHKRLPVEFAIDPKLVVSLGDVLVSRASGSPKLVGSVGRVHELNYQLILSDKTFRPVFGARVDPEFMVLAMNSRSYRMQVEKAISGAEGLANNLPSSSLRTFVFAIPPKHEQEMIVNCVQEETNSLIKAIRRTEKEISLFQEFRTRLIADVVTGKLDVREAAVHLPAELDEPEVIIEDDLLDLELDPDADSDLDAVAEDEAA